MHIPITTNVDTWNIFYGSGYEKYVRSRELHIVYVCIQYSYFIKNPCYDMREILYLDNILLSTFN